MISFVFVRCGWPRRDPSWKEIDEIYERIRETSGKEKQRVESSSTHHLDRKTGAL